MQGQKSFVESNVKGLIADHAGVNADDIGIAEPKTLLFTDE